MDRKTCYMAPVFDQDKLQRGVRVKYNLRNRKGGTKLGGTGTVSFNLVDSLRIEPDDSRIPYTIYLTAKNVYYGKDHLEIIEEV